MTAKEQKLYSFYAWCKDHGYEDMSDDTQSLKAKVYATDLGIRYRDIGKLYQEAKAVYDAEEKRKAQEKAFQESKGQFLMSLEASDGKKINVFLGDDRSIYCTHGNDRHKYRGTPTLTAEKSAVLLYNYHPSQAVYTGASSGGITMGGVHHTEAYMDEKVSTTGNGYIKAASFGHEFTVDKVKLADFVAEKFRRDPWYKRVAGTGKIIYCYDTSKRSNNIFKFNTGKTGYYDIMTQTSMALDHERLPMSECKEIVEFLYKVFSGRYPESDESMYARALSMEATAKTSKKIQECIDLFDQISDYEDSAERADALRVKYEEVLQKEKEEAILKKEANAAKRKVILKKAAVIVPIAVAVIALLITAGKFIKQQIALNTAYKQAVAYMDSAEYGEAWQILKDLDYKDSAELANESLYCQAMEYRKNSEFEQAVKDFHNLGDYKDSSSKLSETYDLWIDAEFAHVESGEFEKAIDGLNNIMFCDYKLMKEQEQEQSEASTGVSTSAEAPAYSGNVYWNLQDPEMTPVMKKCSDKIAEVEKLQAEEEARLAEEAIQAELKAAYETKDANVFGKYLDRFTQLTDEQVKELLRGEWNVLTYNGSRVYFNFDKKNSFKYSSTENGKKNSYDYTIESGAVNLFGVSYYIYDLGNENYLFVNSTNYSPRYLFWHDIEVAETQAVEAEDEIAALAAAEAAGE